VVPELDKFKRDSTAMPDYYKAWDKFGKQLDDLDNEEDSSATPGIIRATQATAMDAKQPQNAQEMMAPTSGAAPNTQLVIKGGLRKQLSPAEELKQQGNSYFVSLEYAKAIDCYNKCLAALSAEPSRDTEKDSEMRKLVLSNRSQAFLKMKVYQSAFDDADEALAIDREHVKSLGRRGQAAFYLRKFKQAKLDFMRGLQLSPDDKTFQEYLKKTLERLQKIKEESYEKMTRRVVFTDLDSLGFDENSTRVPVVELHLDQE
jgi:tetratricopeptide (TPR) repeat protein